MMDDIILYGVSAIIVLVLIVGVRILAQRFSDGARAKAIAALKEAREDAPVLVHAYAGSAMGVYEAEPKIVKLGEGGIAPLVTDSITGWFVGEVSQSGAGAMLGNHSGSDHKGRSGGTHVHYLLIYAGEEDPVVQIGILDQGAEPDIQSALESALPGKQMAEPGNLKSVFTRK